MTDANTPLLDAPSSAESIIELVVRDTSASTGQTFFEQLVRSLALALQVRHCLLTELIEGGQLRTLAFWKDGEIAPSITYNPAPGPCGVVLSKDIYYCESGVQQVFPHQPALPLLEAESYVGVSLRDHRGTVLGNLAVLDSRPIFERKLHEDLLKLFAARASAELERHQAIGALQRLNADLEVRVETRTLALAQQTTDLKNTLQALKQTQANLIQSEKMSSLGCLVAGVAHEINNPISFVKGNLNYAAKETRSLLELVKLFRAQCRPLPVDVEAALDKTDLDYLAEDLPSLFASMTSGVERVQKIVRSLRVFSRLDESGCKQINLNENLDSVLLLLQAQLHQDTAVSDIQLVKQYGEIPLIHCYPGLINQALMNLLYNAIEAIKEKKVACDEASTDAFVGKIYVSTERVSSNQITIRISDNGIGIPENIQSDIFDPFFTTRPIGKGIGLGLSTSYQIVTEQHGGCLTVDSVAGEGAEFVVCLPLSSV